MDAKASLIEARKFLQDHIDRTIRAMPEWSALQQVNSAIKSLEGNAAPAPRVHNVNVSEALSVRDFVIATVGKRPSYAKTAHDLAVEVGRPVTTQEIVDRVVIATSFSGDPEKLRMNVTSALSHSPLMRSIVWNDSRHWWLSEEPIPEEGQSGTKTAGQPTMTDPAANPETGGSDEPAAVE